MTDIDLEDRLADRHIDVLSTMRAVVTQIGNDHWCIVGGMMVLALGAQYGALPRRASETKDLDVLVDIVVQPSSLRSVVGRLEAMGFRLADRFRYDDTEARCTFVHINSQIDVLCPDDTPQALLDVGNNVHSIAIPGGRRALELAEVTDIYFDDGPPLTVRLPTLHGGFIAKMAAAIDLRTRDQRRHIEDAVFLASAVTDPVDFLSRMNDSDRALLAEAPAIDVQRFTDLHRNQQLAALLTLRALGLDAR